MKFFHTADWHLGKLVHGVYMTEDQEYVLEQFIEAVRQERPDAVVIAGDLYDRAIPPTEAVDVLNHVLKTLVVDLETPVLAVAGNHDSPDRVHFGSALMKESGLHLVGRFQYPHETVVLHDAHGPVHFHLVPYADPNMVRTVLQNDDIRSHDDAMRLLVQSMEEEMDEAVRHVFVGHAFVTPTGEVGENTSESERPLSIGGAEYVSSRYFRRFHYTALGHLHQAHYVGDERIRYAGSPLKYSISEERHHKGFYIVEMDEAGNVTTEKRALQPRRDMRTIEAELDDLLRHEMNDDYVFVRLRNTAPVLQPMEKIRSVYPNAMHVERVLFRQDSSPEMTTAVSRHKLDDIRLLEAFYREMKGQELSDSKKQIFAEILEEARRKGE